MPVEEPVQLEVEQPAIVEEEIKESALALETAVLTGALKIHQDNLDSERSKRNTSKEFI